MSQHILIVEDMAFAARITERSEGITICLMSSHPAGGYSVLTRVSIDCWFNAIVHQWPDDPRTVCVLDPQHIMTCA